MPCVYVMVGDCLMFLITVFVGFPSVLIMQICQHGGLTFVCHNELCDLTAAWLQEVCHDVAVEPSCNHLLVNQSLQLQLSLSTVVLNSRDR